MVRIVVPKVVYKYSPHTAIVSACKNCSFDLVATQLAYYLAQYYGKKISVEYSMVPGASILITDIWAFLRDYATYFLNTNSIVWADTALYQHKDTRNPGGASRYNIVTTSPWNLSLLTRLGISGFLIPRHVDDVYANKYFNDGERELDAAAICTTYGGFDRKRTRETYQIFKELNLKYAMVCEYDFCTHRPFSLTQEDKYRLLSKSRVLVNLSSSEGFGMPFAEALSVGTPVVYVNSPYVNFVPSGTYSYPVEPTSVYVRENPNFPVEILPWYDVDMKEVKRVIHDAVRDTPSKATRADIHEYIMSHFSAKVVTMKLVELSKNLGVVI